MATETRALTVAEQVEQSPAVMQLEARSQALVDLLPDQAAVDRFKRVVVQALIKNPDLLQCTPESVVSSVFEAAMQGLEPTGAAGGAHLVPYNVNVGTAQRPRYEKRAQLIPDYRGVIRLVTKPPSEIQSMEARVVKEGDEFAYELGDRAWVRHTPSLAADRSTKATTHVYSVARLRGDERVLVDVMDRAEVQRIQERTKGRGFSPWASDFDEMAKKTVIKRHAKQLPVRPEIRSILVREDELLGQADEDKPAIAATTPQDRPSAPSRLASRLRPGTRQDGPAAASTQDEPPASSAPEGGPEDGQAAGSDGPAGLSEEDFLAALEEAGIDRRAAGRRSTELFPRESGVPLTPEQRAALLEDLKQPKEAL